MKTEEKSILQYSLAENGNTGRIAVWNNDGEADAVFTMGTDTMTTSRGVSLKNSFGIETDSIYPVYEKDVQYAVQAGENYPFYLITCEDAPQTGSFEKMVKDPEHELQNIEDSIIFCVSFTQ